MRLAVLHRRLNPVMIDTVARLRARGITVDLFDPDTMTRLELTSLRAAHDLYYLKTTAELLLSYAGALHAAGAKTINPYPRVAELSNKLVAVVALRRAGLPVPETWLAKKHDALDDLFEGGSLVVKPHRGTRGRGVTFVHRRDELAAAMARATERDDAPVLVQRHHQTDDGRDHKLYCIGERVFGVRRAWRVFEGSDEKARASEAFEPEPALREMTLRCGQALGLSLYGIDVVISRGMPYIVDVNECAGFIGVPDAATVLSDYLASALR